MQKRLRRSRKNVSEAKYTTTAVLIPIIWMESQAPLTEDNPLRTPVVGTSQRAEALLSGCKQKELRVNPLPVRISLLYYVCKQLKELIGARFTNNQKTLSDIPEIKVRTNVLLQISHQDALLAALSFLAETVRQFVENHKMYYVVLYAFQVQVPNVELGYPYGIMMQEAADKQN